MSKAERLLNLIESTYNADEVDPSIYYNLVNNLSSSMKTLGLVVDDKGDNLIGKFSTRTKLSSYDALNVVKTQLKSLFKSGIKFESNGATIEDIATVKVSMKNSLVSVIISTYPAEYSDDMSSRFDLLIKFISKLKLMF